MKRVVEFYSRNKKKVWIGSLFMILTTVLMLWFFVINVISSFDQNISDIKEMKLSFLKNPSSDSLVNSIIQKLNVTESLELTSDQRNELEVIQLDLINDWIPAPDVRYDSPTLPKQENRRPFCSTIDPSPPLAKRTSRFARYNPSYLRNIEIEIPVAFHVITDSNGNGSLNSLDTLLKTQLDTLNSAFESADISFRLDTITTYKNNTWYNYGFKLDSVEAADDMTSSISIKPNEILNVYILKGSGKWLGEASFPWWSSTGSHEDGVKILNSTLPGGADPVYNEGNTLVHEVGHYLGLLHTFHFFKERCVTIDGVEECEEIGCQDSQFDGCDPSFGDLVDDTPAQKYCHFDGCGDCQDNIGCEPCLEPRKKCDTCPSAGVDPVRNYMGYNGDRCMTEFSKGQLTRVKQSILKHRSNFIKNGSA